MNWRVGGIGSLTMNILAFDTCFGACSVAVGRDVGHEACHFEQAFERRQSGHAEALMGMIERTMAAGGLRFSALDRIAVTTGPGTFTGTRIGIAAARAFGLATGVALVGLSSLAVMAEELAGDVAATQGTEDLMIAVDARRGQVYAQIFGAGGLDAKSAPLLVTVLEAARMGGSGPIIVAGSGAEAVAAAAAGAGRLASARLPELEPDASRLLALAPRLEPQAAPPRPLYLRPPDARPQDGKSLARTS